MNKKILSILAIVIIGLIAYSNSFDNGFQFDDVGYIVENPHIRDINRPQNIMSSLQRPVRFIAFYTFALNYHVHQLDVFGYHVVNFLIHIITALLVWSFILLLFNTPRIKKEPIYQQRNLFALMAALLFVAHPIQTQAITYICQRFASLATMFYMGSIVLYLSARISKGGVIKKSLLFLCSVCVGMLGMFTKEITITLPISILIMEWIFLKRVSTLQLIKQRWYVILVILGFILVIPFVYKFAILGTIFGGETIISESHRGDFITTGRYFLTQFRVITTYIRLLLVPIGLNLDYDYVLSYSLLEWDTFLCFAFLLSLVFFAFKIRKKYPFVAFGIFWFFLTLSVESSIIPIQHVIFEHRTYLPSVGFFIAVAIGLSYVLRQQKRYVTVLSMVVLVLTILTVQRNQVWQDGTTLWKDVIAKSPHKARGYLNLGYAYAQQGDFDLALDYFEQALDIYPDDEDVYINRGIIYETQKKYEQALADYNKALQLNPQADDAYNNRGVIYEARQQYELALADYNKALDINPKHEEAYNNRGLVYKATQQYQKALADYNMALDLNPNSQEALNNRAQVYRALDKLELVFQDYTQAITINPQFAEAYSNRGLIYKEQGIYQKALEDYNRAIELDPDLTEAYNNRGVLLKELRQYQNAINDFNKAIELSPNSEEAYNNRGIVLKAVKRYDLALRDYDIALQLNPNYAFAYSNRGSVYEAKGQHELALADYNKALSLNPNMPEVHNNIGVIYKEQDKLELAIQEYNKAISLNPDYAMAYNNRGVIHRILGNIDQAFADFDQAVRVNPNNPLAFFNRGTAFINKKDYKRAIADYDQYLALDPNKAVAYYLRSQAHSRIGSYQKALEDARKAQALGYAVNQNYLKQLANQ